MDALDAKPDTFRTSTFFDTSLSFKGRAGKWGHLQYNKMNPNGFTLLGDSTGAVGIGEGIDDGDPTHFFRGGGFGACGNHYYGNAA
jgi:hypothetical protein